MTLFRIPRCALALAEDMLSGSFCAYLRNKMGNIGSQSVKTQTGVCVLYSLLTLLRSFLMAAAISFCFSLNNRCRFLSWLIRYSTDLDLPVSKAFLARATACCSRDIFWDQMKKISSNLQKAEIKKRWITLKYTTLLLQLSSHRSKHEQVHHTL